MSGNSDILLCSEAVFTLVKKRKTEINLNEFQFNHSGYGVFWKKNVARGHVFCEQS